MVKKVFLCCLIIGFVSVAISTITDCGSNAADFKSISITDCETSASQCILHRNTNVTIQIVFTPKENVEHLSAVVHGIIMGVPIPFVLPNSDGCVDSGITCPLKTGETYTYTTSLPVLVKYPRVTVGVKFELQSGNATDLTCSLIPAKIQ